MPKKNFKNFGEMQGYEYLKGVISSVDGDTDTCTLSINEVEYSAVPIYYHCSEDAEERSNGAIEGGAAGFDEDDEVIVLKQREGLENKIFVVGHIDGAKQCYPCALLIYGNPEEYLSVTYAPESPVFIPESVTCTDGGTGTIAAVVGNILYGAFIKCWTGTLTGLSSGAQATVNGAIESHYTRNYKYKEIFTASIADGVDEIALSGALDQPPISDISAEGTPPSTECWSKTLDDLTISAFIYYPSGIVSYATKQWGVVGQYNGTQVQWAPNDWSYPVGGNARCAYPAYGWTDTHIGFDLWTEGSGDSKEYFMGLIADYARNYTYWKLNITTNIFELQLSKRSMLTSHELYHESYTRLIGYGYKDGTHTAYWAALRYGSEYLEENLITGDITVHERDGMIETALWDPIARTLKLVVEDDCVEGETETTSIGSVAIGHGCQAYGTTHPSAYCGSISYTPGSWDQAVTVYGAECLWDEESGNPDPWPQGFDSWSRGYTRAWRTTHTITDCGSFWIGDNEFNQGGVDNSLEEVREITLERYMGYCSTTYTNLHDDGISADLKCALIDRLSYDFRGWIFGPGGELAYRYADLEYYVETDFCNPSNPLTSACIAKCAEKVGECASDCYAFDYEGSYEECQCAEYDWQEKEVGPSDLTPFIDATFPHDHTWRAILLQGCGRTMVVYKSGSGLFLHDGNNLNTIGEYTRAFFQVHEST